MATKILKTLEALGLTSNDTRELFSPCTRDQEKLNVWRDKSSEVIFISDFFVGDEVFQSGEYREEKLSLADRPDYERHSDAIRRFSYSKQFLIGKHLVDFGCGDGGFLFQSQDFARSVAGVELQRDYREKLNAKGIKCFDGIEHFTDKSVDVVTLFHVLEHLPDPIPVLKKINTKLASGGYVIIEVPHARDILFNELACEKFKKFTLWSQHLILHTRASLTEFLVAAGFNDIVVQGVQRYSLANHLNWLSFGKPGGHKGSLSILDNASLRKEYEASLAAIDATDTLIAVAKKR